MFIDQMDDKQGSPLHPDTDFFEEHTSDDKHSENGSISAGNLSGISPNGNLYFGCHELILLFHNATPLMNFPSPTE